jgi:hypothetical protein
MGSGSQLATGVTAFTGLLVFLVACVLLFLQNGQRRAALVAGLAPAALVPAVIAVALAAMQIAQSFAGMAAGGSGGATAVLAMTRETWWTARLGFGVAALIGLVGLASGLARFGSPPAGTPACSLRRAAVLTLLPCLALLVVAVQVRELRLGVGIAQAVVADTAAIRRAARPSSGTWRRTTCRATARRPSQPSRSASRARPSSRVSEAAAWRSSSSSAWP